MSMDRIILKDFEVVACHGVNPEEKVEPQRFLFTVVLDVDFSDAAANDDLSKTVSYAAVKKAVKAFCEDNCFDLIETLCARLAELLLKQFELARAVEVTVKKPDAPMSGKFDYAGVSAMRKRHRAYLALGSSEGDRNAYLDFAVAALKADGNIAHVRESQRIATAPYGGVAKGMFLNSAVECDTLYTARQLLNKIHSIEAEGGRVRKERWGDRTLDIDIIFFDDEVCEDDDLCIPHIDMANRAFVLKPLCELCPNKVHPLLKRRVRELSDALEDETNNI